MTTTIQISEETKEKLFMIINQLEKKRGSRVTYDEAIKFLFKEEKEFRREVFLENIRKYQGILKPNEGKELLKELREKDYEREQKFT